jgi:hypothetical protein
MPCFSFTGAGRVLAIAINPAILGAPLCCGAGSVQGLATTFYFPNDSYGPGTDMPFSGSVLGQSFFAQAGDILSFDYDYITDDNDIDLAVAALDGSLTLLGCCTNPASPAGALFPATSGYQTLSLMIPTTGMHHIAFGAFQTFDDIFPTALLVDKVAVASVPEPSTWLLLAFALVGIGLAKRRLNSVREDEYRQTRRQTAITPVTFAARLGRITIASWRPPIVHPVGHPAHIGEVCSLPCRNCRSREARPPVAD